MAGQSLRLATIRLIAEAFVHQVLSDDDVRTVIGVHGEADPNGAVLLLTLASCYRAERWEIGEARALLALAGEFSEAVRPDVLHRLSLMAEIVDALEGLPVDRDAEGANLLRPGSTDPGVLLLQGRALMSRERYAEARGVFSRAMSHAEITNTLWFDLANFARIGNEIGAGEFRLARTAISAWGQSANQVNCRAPLGAFITAWKAYSLGQLPEAHAALASCVQLSSLESGEGLHARALALRGAIHLLDHDLEASVMDFRQVSAMSSRLRNPTLLRHWADYVEVCVRTGRLQEARGAMESLEHRLVTHHSRWGQLALRRCQALVMTGIASIELFIDAAKDFGRDESPYELGRTMTCLAQRQEALGLVRESRRTRMSAVTAFERAGADAWAIRVAAGPATTADSSPLDQLNAEEREITRRIRDGQRTREIAEALHLSVRTIELRLTHIYRTLGVASRAQLVILLSR